MNSKIIFALVAALALSATAGLVIYLRATAVPTRSEPVGWYFGKDPGPRLPVDDAIQKLIRRARLDHLVAPAPGANRYLRIGDVRSDPPDAIYLVFPNSLSDHSAVIYRCGVKQHSIDWKAIDYNSP